MSNPYQQYPDQHDTAAYARQAPPAAAGQGAGSAWYVPGEPVGSSNPEADYWAGKYRRQRRWTRALAGGATGLVLVAVGLGFTTLQARSSDQVATAGQAQDSTSPDGTGDATTPGGTAPDTTPDSTTPDGTTPDSVRSLGSSRGITDLNQLVQMAVAMGMVSEEDAADLLAAAQGGAALGDLFGGSDRDQGDTGSTPGTGWQGTPPQGAPGQGSGPHGTPGQGSTPQDGTDRTT